MRSFIWIPMGFKIPRYLSSHLDENLINSRNGVKWESIQNDRKSIEKSWEEQQI